MSSSSPATANCSRSSSPTTPESSDNLDPIPNDFDLFSWKENVLDCQVPMAAIVPGKPDFESPLCLNDIIDERAYEEQVLS